ncbi:MAG TPA: pyridoxamine 5'-phosphate oxidase family protein [Chloroflexia bacterium]|nr:pyridoxamine 5'-phosphate oxidase family protein [Chloroflexia bacterium]
MQPEQVLQVMNDPLAQDLLHSDIPARLAYTGRDGSPRAIPVGFLWTGSHIVIGTAANSPKMHALQANPQVALTIDTNTFPPHVLLVRGRAQVEIVEGVAPEYLEASKKYVPPEQWETFEQQVRALYKQQGRIIIAPQWAKILDFDTRMPQAQEELVQQQRGPR